MFLDLSEIVVREGMRTDLEVDQPGVEDPDLVFDQPIRGRLHFSNSGELINAVGEIECALLVPCSRCLTSVHVPVHLHVEEHFPIEEVLHPDRPPDEDSGLETLVSSVVHLDQGRPILDLDELFRQLIVTEVPISTVCREACAGLCPRCGTNLNEAHCACVTEEPNTPLARLGALLHQNGGSE